MSSEGIFSSRAAADPRWMILFKRLVIFVVALHLLIGLISSYRAYFQVHSVDISTNELLQDGSLIKTRVVSYGRTPVDVKLEIIQNGIVVKLHEQRVAANEFGFYDPRTQTGSFTVLITAHTLNQLESGAAVLRATAVGRHQWMRLPPPFVREVNVNIE